MATLMVTAADMQVGFSLSRLFGRILGNRPTPSEAEQDEARNRRDFLMDMLDRHPDAFASEHDVQSMMRLYPGHF